MKEDRFMHIECIEYFAVRAKLMDSINPNCPRGSGSMAISPHV